MGRFYDRFILPRMINFACKGSTIQKQREKIIHHAKGNVVEIGIGSALNFKFYDWSRISSLTGIDPSSALWNMRDLNNDPSDIPVSFMEGRAEELPFKDRSADTVVMTYCFCSVEDPDLAVKEIIRILKPDGKFIFSEHALSPDPGVRKWQNRINPYWRKVSGGCNLNRDTTSVLKNNGFNTSAIEGMQLPGWSSANWHIWGVTKLIEGKE